MFKRSIHIIAAFILPVTAMAQEKWDLRKCVEYAIANNISVKQTDLQTRFSELSYKQSKQAQLPSLNLQASSGYRFGRSENPTTGVLEDNNFLNAGFSLQSGVTIFNWFSQKNTIEAERLTHEADKAQVKKVQDDIALVVAVAYLQVLLTREQANIAKIQIQTTSEQLNNTRKRVDAGTLPELNAAELEAQLSRDSSNYITAEATVKQFLLQLKAALNLDAGLPFDVETPPVDRVPLDNLADLQPEAVYALALANLPLTKVIDLRLQAARKSVEAAKGQLYPRISAFGGLGSNYVNIKIPQFQPGAPQATAAFVTVGTTTYNVFTPSFVQVGEKAIPFGTQINNNFSQNIGIGFSVPIFNGGVAKAGWERSKLMVKQWELNKEQDNQKLKQDIYNAHNDAVAALQKYNADKKSVETASRSYEFAQKRYDLNLLSTFDLISSQSNLLRSKLQALYSQYDYVFKIKLLEYYKGQGIRL
jgi:outer membrane protein